jgi:hypothetical protein
LITLMTKKGDMRYAVLYPKYKKGGHIVRKLKEDCSYGMSYVVVI